MKKCGHNPLLDGTASNAAGHFTLLGAARQFNRCV